MLPFYQQADASLLKAHRGWLVSGSGRRSAMKVANCSNMVACESCVVSRVARCDRSVRTD